MALPHYYNNMNKQLTAKIKKWLKDWDKTYPKNLQIDDDTFEGGAYYLLKEVLALPDNKKTKDDIITFFELVIEGIRGEYEQGWSHRDDAQDIKTLREYLNNL